MPREPYVERWLERKPAEATLRRVRDIILWSDNRVKEYLKNGTVHFAFNGDFANFVHHDQKTVTLMFPRGARIPGSHPHLEGGGPSARFMRFAGVDEVNDVALELGSVVVTWCRMMSPPQPNPKAGGGRRR